MKYLMIHQVASFLSVGAVEVAVAAWLLFDNHFKTASLIKYHFTLFIDQFSIDLIGLLIQSHFNLVL